jgi:hypothetical protein
MPINVKNIQDGYDLRRELVRMCLRAGDLPIDYDVVGPNGLVALEEPVVFNMDRLELVHNC